VLHFREKARDGCAVRILLHEFVTGGGWHEHTAGPPPESLLAEGRAMLQALAADFAAGGISLDVLRNERYGDFPLPVVTIHRVASLDEEQQTLRRVAAAADWTVIIAPEFCGYLHTRCRLVEESGGRLLGPTSKLVALSSDKQATAEHLAGHGVRVPRGLALAPFAALPAEFDYPAVLKPRDGAGSLGIERIATSAGRINGTSPARLESFCPGQPASVAVLCGPEQLVPLSPCFQHLGGQQGFSYLGGSLPIPAELANRAAGLALDAIRSLSGQRGYLGVDLVLGLDPSGSEDVVIEINPRLTTSYVGLRALFEGNLAAAMLAIAAGSLPELCWKPGPIAFEASGSVRQQGGPLVR
jgi:predicted ATP-grasp superfamily ATP-dependent carboligase